MSNRAMESLWELVAEDNKKYFDEPRKEIDFLIITKYNLEVMNESMQAKLDLMDPTTCEHEWITTMGFVKQYIDCKHCGAKQEEMIPTEVHDLPDTFIW